MVQKRFSSHSDYFVPETSMVDYGVEDDVHF